MYKKKKPKSKELDKGKGNLSGMDKGSKSNRVQRENIQERVKTCPYCKDVIVKEEFTKHKKECSENPKKKSKLELELMISGFKNEMNNTIKNIKVDNVIVPKDVFAIIAGRWLKLQDRSAFNKRSGSEALVWERTYNLLFKNCPGAWSQLNEKLNKPKRKKQ